MSQEIAPICTLNIKGKKVSLIFAEGIFIPSATSLFVVNHLQIKSHETVFDIGTGSGFFAILASMLGAKKVFASDHDLLSVQLAIKNIKINRLDNITVMHNSFFGRKKQKYDVIIANLPQFPIPKTPPGNRPIWKLVDGGGTMGNRMVCLFLEKAVEYLRPGGRIYFPLVSISSPQQTMAVIKKLYKYRVIATQEILFSHFNYATFDWMCKLKERGRAEFYQMESKMWYFSEKLYELSLKNHYSKNSREKHGRR